MVVLVTESDLGTNKPCFCPNCQRKFLVAVVPSLASRFVNVAPTPPSSPVPPDTPTYIRKPSLVLEVIPNECTLYQRFELFDDFTTIGRENDGGLEFCPDVAVQTGDTAMSRMHAAILRRGKNDFVLKDISSKNGILVNNVQGKIEGDEEMTLSTGDIFRLGRTEIRVSILN